MSKRDFMVAMISFIGGTFFMAVFFILTAGGRS